MCLLYLVAIIIIFLLLWKLMSKNNNVAPQKCIESFQENTVTFTKPQNMFLKAMNDIKNAPKIVLENVVSKCYMDKNTIDTELNNRVNNILKDVISHLNKILKEDEYFIKELEGLYIIKDDKGNFRLIISSFIYDIKNYYQVKFIMDVVYMNDEYYLNYMNIDERATNNMLNKYDVRSVNNNTTGLLLSYDMINDDLEHTLNDHYKTNDNILDFKNITNNDNQYKFVKISDLSKYYLPDGVPNLFSPIFCDKDSNDWTTNGVPKQNNNLPDTCIANNNSITKILNSPYDAPGVSGPLEKSWLFNIFANPGIMTSN